MLLRAVVNAWQRPPRRGRERFSGLLDFDLANSRMSLENFCLVRSTPDPGMMLSAFWNVWLRA